MLTNQRKNATATPYQEFLDGQGGRDGNREGKKLDYSAPLYWNTNDYPNVEYAEIVESMYLLQKNESIMKE